MTTRALDYADQRYYASSYGRFNTADPYQASAGPADPGSWNRYAYVGGDPINFNDPQGLMAKGVCTFDASSGDGSCNDDGPSYSANGRDPHCTQSSSAFLDPAGQLASTMNCYGPGAGSVVFTTVAYTPPKCPDNIRNFFNIMIPIASNLASSLNTSTNDILALSSYESGWLDAHNQALHNPFGLTKAGGNNLNFKGGYQAAADFWKNNDGKYVIGIFDITDFATSLQPHYNTVNPNWTSDIVKQLTSVEKWRAICGQ